MSQRRTTIGTKKMSKRVPSGFGCLMRGPNTYNLICAFISHITRQKSSRKKADKQSELIIVQKLLRPRAASHWRWVSSLSDHLGKRFTYNRSVKMDVDRKRWTTLPTA